MIALTPKESMANDKYMIGTLKIPGIVLMENAAFAVSALCTGYDRAYVFCGSGNNGGDGFAVARQLKTMGKHVTAILIGDIPKGDAFLNAQYFLKGDITRISSQEQLNSLFWDITSKDLIVDALFGTGLSRNVEGIYKETIKLINASRAYTIAVDIPSGVNGENGHIMGECVVADETVTFQYPKPGHFLYPGCDAVGKLSLHKIGIDEGSPVLNKAVYQVYASGLWELAPVKRSSNTHKGSYGHLIVFCGGVGYTGAGVMCVNGALKAGAGVVYAAIPTHLHDIYAKKLTSAVIQPVAGTGDKFEHIPEATIDELLAGKNCVCIGSGMGKQQGMEHTLKYLLTLKIAKVLDADALNILSYDKTALNRPSGEVVITPHPKEFSRLTGLELEYILQNPVVAAVNYARQNHVTVLLKGATTVIADKGGEKVCLVRAGTPGMAKGGSGDVLSGVVAAFMAQGLGGYDAASMGAFVCGKAGERAARKFGEYSMTPMDTIGEIFL